MTMSRRDREDLAKLVRRQEKLAKTDAAKVAAERLADFEAQLATKYDFYDERWREATAKLKDAVREANEQIARERAQRASQRPSTPRPVDESSCVPLPAHASRRWRRLPGPRSSAPPWRCRRSLSPVDSSPTRRSPS
jgi:hypothetical protein